PHGGRQRPAGPERAPGSGSRGGPARLSARAQVPGGRSPSRPAGGDGQEPHPQGDASARRLPRRGGSPGRRLDAQPPSRGGDGGVMFGFARSAGSGRYGGPRGFAAGEEPGDDPHAGEPDEAVDDAGGGVGLAELQSEDGRYEVELCQGDEPPIDRADPGEGAGA